MAGTVKIRHGVPGITETDKPGKHTYPESAIDMEKIIRAAGLTPEFEDPPEVRSYVGHKANDIWLPILQVTSDLLINMSGGLFTFLLIEFLNPWRGKDVILHVKQEVIDTDGRMYTFEMHGNKTIVVEALNEFQRQFDPEHRHEEVEGGPTIDGPGDTADRDRRSR